MFPEAEHWTFNKRRCNGGRWSTFSGHIALLPSDVIDFTILPSQRFWQEKVSSLDFMRPVSNQLEHAMLEKILQLYNNLIW